MLSRVRYVFRETFDSFRRNATLTVASIITAAISLLGVGLTLLSQEGFDNLLSKWEGGLYRWALVMHAMQCAEHSLLLLMQHLDHARWQPHLACPDGTLARQAREDGIPWHSISLPPGVSQAAVYQDPADFVSEAFRGNPPAPKVLWLTPEMRQEVEAVLGHAPNGMRMRY